MIHLRRIPCTLVAVVISFLTLTPAAPAYEEGTVGPYRLAGDINAFTAPGSAGPERLGTYCRQGPPGVATVSVRRPYVAAADYNANGLAAQYVWWQTTLWQYNFQTEQWDFSAQFPWVASFTRDDSLAPFNGSINPNDGIAARNFTVTQPGAYAAVNELFWDSTVWIPETAPFPRSWVSFQGQSGYVSDLADHILSADGDRRWCQMLVDPNSTGTLPID